MRALRSTRLTILLTALIAAPAIADDYLGAMGIGVADLKVSEQFYADAVGLKTLRSYELGYLNEIVMGYDDDRGAVVVLMNWPGQERVYDGNNVKLVFYVDDPAKVIERMRAKGSQIDREALPIEVLKGKLVGLGRDPDNYVVELVQR
jgi:predicted enzyme related to lactoylglutathione lyase